MKPLKLAVVALVVLAVGAGATATAAADTASNEQTTDEVRIVDEEITISDAVITVSNTTVAGTGLGDEAVEDRRYTVDSTIDVDGLHVTHDGTRYTICDVTIHVENVGIHVTDTTVTGDQ